MSVPEPSSTLKMIEKASPALRLLLQVGGVSGLIALYLVYTLAGGVARDAQASVLLLQKQQAEFEKYQLTLTTELPAIRNLLLQNCVNNAGDDVKARNACFDAMYTSPRRTP